MMNPNLQFDFSVNKEKKRNSPDNMPQRELNRPIESYFVIINEKNQRNSPDDMLQHKWNRHFKSF